MPDLEPQTNADLTARLVEELSETKQRLERLEAILAERSLLPSIQQEPERLEAVGQTKLSADAQSVGAAANGVHASANADTAEAADACFRKGVALCQAGNYDAALAAWQDVLRLQPDNPFALANIGIVLTEQGRWAEARNLFIRVLEIQPNNAEAHYGLGMADAQLGNYAGAIAAWENTIRLQPDNTDAHYNIALVRQRIGQQGGLQAGKAADEQASPPASVTAPAESPAHTDIAAESDSSIDGEMREAEAEGMSLEPQAPAQSPDWKRVDSASRSGQRGGLVRQGAGRLSRPSRPKASRVPAGLILVVGGALVGMYAFSHYRQAKPDMKPASGTRAALASPSGTTPPKTATPPADTGEGNTTVVPAVVEGPDNDASAALAAEGPAHQGKMQIRLGPGVTGQFRYWFVSGADRAPRMRWLPRANRAGIIVLWVPAEVNRPGTQLRILDVSRGKVAHVPLMDVSRATVVLSPNVGANLLQNADFSQGAKGWSLETAAPGRGTVHIQDGLAAAPGVTGKAAHFEVLAIGKQPWSVQCYQMSVNLADRVPYLLSFWAKSDRTRSLRIDGILDKADWHPIGLGANLKLGTTWQKYTVPFTANRTEPNHTRVSFVLGETTGTIDLSGISLRPSQGAAKSTALSPNTAVTISARDFN